MFISVGGWPLITESISPGSQHLFQTFSLLSNNGGASPQTGDKRLLDNVVYPSSIVLNEASLDFTVCVRFPQTQSVKRRTDEDSLLKKRKKNCFLKLTQNYLPKQHEFG